MSLPLNSTLTVDPLKQKKIAFNVKLSDDLLSKISSSKPKLVIKNGQAYLKLVHSDGSESMLDSNIQEESSHINLYSAATGSAAKDPNNVHKYNLVGKVTSRLSIFGNGIKRTKSGTESKVGSASVLARSSESPPNNIPHTSTSSVARRTNKLVAISGLASRHSPENRILHLLALGPISIPQIQRTCKLESYSFVENFLKTHGEILTSQSVAYQQDRYFTYDRFPHGQGRGYQLPSSLQEIRKREDAGEEAKFYILKDSSYKHIKLWDWRFYNDNHRKSIAKNMANAFDRMKISSDDPIRNLLISPEVLSKTLKEKEEQKEELKRKQFEEEQRKQEQYRLETARELERQAKERERKLKEERKNFVAASVASNANTDTNTATSHYKNGASNNPSLAPSNLSSPLHNSRSANTTGRRNVNNSLPVPSNQPPGNNNILQKLSKSSRASPMPSTATNNELQKKITKATSQTKANTPVAKEQPRMDLDANGSLIELSSTISRPKVELTPAVAKTAPHSPHNKPLKTSISTKKAVSSSPRLSASSSSTTTANNNNNVAKSRKRKVLSNEIITSSDEEVNEMNDHLSSLGSKSSAANAASTSASAEYTNSARKKPRTISNSSSGSMSSSSNSSSSSRMSSSKNAVINSPYSTSPPSSGNVSSPEIDVHSGEKKPAKKMISNITSKSLANVKYEASSPSASKTSAASLTTAISDLKNDDKLLPQAVELATKFKEKYAEYQSLYLHIQRSMSKKNKGKSKNIKSFAEDDVEDVKRVIQLHNELTLWKKRLWAMEHAWKNKDKQKQEKVKVKSKKPGEKSEKVERPEKPERFEKLEKPKERSEKPKERSEKPRERSEKPRERPEKPRERPEKPRERPEKPRERPEKPRERPEKPRERSEKPRERPERPKERPLRQERLERSEKPKERQGYEEPPYHRQIVRGHSRTPSANNAYSNNVPVINNTSSAARRELKNEGGERKIKRKGQTPGAPAFSSAKKSVISLPSKPAVGNNSKVSKNTGYKSQHAMNKQKIPGMRTSKLFK